MTDSAQFFTMSAIMSKPIAPTPVVTTQVTPPANHQAVNPPTSRAQTNAQLISTSATESDASEPTLSNKEAPKSPLDDPTDSTASNSLVLEHSAPESRERSASAIPASGPTTTAGAICTTLTIAALTEVALSGDIKAQFKLGERYYFGDSVEINHAQAFNYFLLAAEGGDADAQVNLGKMFLNGDGVGKDKSDAFIWFQKAARQGNFTAQYNLGLMYYFGDSIPKDDIQALNYFRESADRGHSDSQCQLGLMYEKGLGVERDEKKAFDLFLKAAHKDNANAQFEVGRMYANGTVVVKDDDQALKWISKAAKQGLHLAKLALAHFYTNGPEKNKDLYSASYQLLQSGLQPDGKSINLYGFRSVNSNTSNLVKLFPVVLEKFPEFEKVRSLVFNYNDVSDENFSCIGELIRSNTTLLSLCLTSGKLKNDDARLLAQALENNTTLIEFTSVGQIDKNIHDQILKSLKQNRSIAKLRKYMLDHPIKRSDVLPIEVLEILVDKMIVSYLKSGHSYKYTVNAINEFLVSSGINSVFNDLEKINKNPQ